MELVRGSGEGLDEVEGEGREAALENDHNGVPVRGGGVSESVLPTTAKSARISRRVPPESTSSLWSLSIAKNKTVLNQTERNQIGQDVKGPPSI